MRCKLKVRQVRHLIREGAKDFVIVNGKMYVDVMDKVDELEPDQALLWYPTGWSLEQLDREIASEDDTQHRQKMQIWKDRIGQNVYVDFVDEPGEDYFVLYAKFSDGVEIWAQLPSFWLEVSSSTDWRPNESIPEDFYAL